MLYREYKTIHGVISNKYTLPPSPVTAIQTSTPDCGVPFFINARNNLRRVVASVEHLSWAVVRFKWPYARHKSTAVTAIFRVTIHRTPAWTIV